MRFRKSEKGFTLVELLIVLAIIAALSTVLVPNIPRWTNSAKAGVIESDISQIANSMIQYVNSEGGSIQAAANTATLLSNSPLSGFFTKEPSDPFGGYILVKTSNSTDITAASGGGDTYGLIMYDKLPSYVADKIQNDLGSDVVSKGSLVSDSAGAITTSTTASSIVYYIKLK